MRPFYGKKLADLAFIVGHGLTILRIHTIPFGCTFLLLSKSNIFAYYLLIAQFCVRTTIGYVRPYRTWCAC
jgi:hypothetical protein